MSEPARHSSFAETSARPSTASGSLRDWLAAMRAMAPDAQPVERPASERAEEKIQSWTPRVVAPALHGEERDDGVAEVVAENMMLKAKLRLEAERRDELQILLAQEIRELRAHINEEIANLEDLRAERDLWKARCEALMQPLFQGAATR